MVPPLKEGIKYFFTLQNPKTVLYEAFIDKTADKIYTDFDQKKIPVLDETMI